jgi:polar amino acid transport system permease protein
MSLPADARPNPYLKRNRLTRRLARAPWWLLVTLLLMVFLIISVSENSTYQQAWANVRQGIWTTIWVSVVAYTLAVVLGLIIALLRRSSNPVVYQAVTFYVEIVRGIPTLVLVYYVVLALAPALVNAANDLGAAMIQSQFLPGLGETLAAIRVRDVNNAYRAIIGLAVSYSAFLSEIFRAGLESVDIGQQEAAMSLGMNRWQVLRYIILPQAIRNILPPLGNDFIALLKESSLVSIVGVEDITRSGATYASATFTFFQTYNVVAFTYLILTLSLSMLVKWMENRLNRGKAQRGE